MKDVMNEIIRMLPFLLPILVIQFCLQVYCIVDLVKRKKVRFDNKLLWGIIIAFGQLLGPVVYLALRGDDV